MALVLPAMIEFYRHEPYYLRLHLEEMGITTIAQLQRRSWSSINGKLSNLTSLECAAVLDLLHWMASNSISFRDFDPHAAFQTPIVACGFPIRFHNALIRINIRRLEMLSIFTAEQVREASKGSIGAGGLFTLRAALAKHNNHFKGEAK